MITAAYFSRVEHVGGERVLVHYLISEVEYYASTYSNTTQCSGVVFAVSLRWEESTWHKQYCCSAAYAADTLCGARLSNSSPILRNYGLPIRSRYDASAAEPCTVHGF